MGCYNYLSPRGEYNVKYFSEIEDLDEFIQLNNRTRFINKRRTISLIQCGFDIETTNIVERNKDLSIKSSYAVMYHWQISIDKCVILGRTWDELETLFEWLDSHVSGTLIIHVANLGFEFSFLMSHFEINQCFARTSYHPLYFRILHNIEFRDSLQITGGNLEYLAKHYCSKDNQKLKGDIDFKKIRHNNTPLSEQEIKYCINDVTILEEFAGYIFKNFKDVPLTKTSILRSECRQEFEKLSDNTKKYIQGLMPTEKEYKLIMEYLFSGGYTHGNLMLINQELENVASLDIVSSYPAVMLQCYFPMTKFSNHKFVTDGHEIRDNLLNTHCCYFTAVFTNVKIKHSHCILSEHKMIHTVNAKYDNGKLYKADAIKLMMTELDYQNFCKFYTWDKIAVRNGHVAQRGKLPNYLTKLIQKYYQMKNQLKKEGKKNTLEYMLTKEKLNSFYGMCVTKIIREDLKFDNVNLEFYPELSNKPWFLVRKKSFLSPYWGIWVTAHARDRLLSMIYEITVNSENVSDIIYCDTDSIYVRNYDKHKTVIDRYNQRITGENKKNLPEGFETLGTFDLECMCDKFKCLGAKRYMKKIGCEYHATIAGVDGDTYLDTMPMCKNPFEYFDLYLTNILDLDVSGKRSHYYFPTKTDYTADKFVVVNDGQSSERMPCFSGCCIFDVGFEMKFGQTWVSMIKNVYENLGVYE